jgi:Photosynthetic reaction centre cytochrome C subunit
MFAMTLRHASIFGPIVWVVSAAVNLNALAAGPVAPGRATNLKVLPKGISQADIVQLMVRYTQDLNVQCQFCHVENPQTQQVDFASDENPMKATARIMIGMLNDINAKYLAQIGDRRYAVPLTCGNCHQGQTFPPPFEPKPVG